MKKLLLVLLFLCGHAYGQAVSQPFQPLAGQSTKSIAVTGSAQALTCDSITQGTTNSYRFEVRDTTTGTAGPPVTISFGTTITAATAASIGNNMEMLPNTVEVFTLPSQLAVSVIASTTGSTFRCTAGAGQ